MELQSDSTVQYCRRNFPSVTSGRQRKREQKRGLLVAVQHCIEMSGSKNSANGKKSSPTKMVDKTWGEVELVPSIDILFTIFSMKLANPGCVSSRTKTEIILETTWRFDSN